MRQLITVLCLLLGACASTVQCPDEARLDAARPARAPFWRGFAVTATALDLGATLAGMRAGAQEQNPVLGQRPARIVAVNAAILGAVWWFSRDLPPERQARIWKWVGALHLGAALWNWNQVKQR
jgi:hypothetical protein